MTSARRCADVWFVVRFAPRVSRLCAGLSALDVTIRGGLFYLLSKQAGRRADLDELEAGFGLPRVRDAHHTLGVFIFFYFKQPLHSLCNVARLPARRVQTEEQKISIGHNLYPFSA